MKAARFHTPGDSSVIRYEDVDDPSPARGEILVRVGACGVNRIDVWLRSGRYQTHLPHILGTDVAGEVAEVSSDVKNFQIGDRVLLDPVLSDGNCVYCLNGHPNQCLNVGLIGAAIDGGYAEYVKIRASNAINLADDLDFETGAAIPVNFATAWAGLVTKAHVGNKHTVFVWGAGSGVGTAAIQISKMFGATVIATASSDEKLAMARKLGADSVVNHRKENVAEHVRKLSGGLGASVVLDHVGETTWPISVDCLSKGGILLTLGATTGVNAKMDVGKIYRNEIKVFGVYGFTREDLMQVLEKVRESKLRPVIYKKMPLSSASEAHRILESGGNFGKILLLPPK